MTTPPNTDTPEQFSAAPQGLTQADVALRVAAGKANIDAGVKTRTIGQIMRENIVTLFNFVNIVLAVLVAFTGSYKNMLFISIIFINCVIGIVQEIRSKRTTDKLAIVVASKVTALRDGSPTELDVDQIVLDDIIRLHRGDQVPADCVVVSGTCKANESLLTGESNLIDKPVGAELMSGSFVNQGTVYARVIHVGADNYAAKITAQAKGHKKVNSEIMTSLNAIVKYVSIILLPVGALLFANQYLRQGLTYNDAILSTVSALVGMIPEGLILLTSTVLAVAVIRLSKSQVLVQQLYCIETLARVDTLCLDKTGTITTGQMKLEAIIPIKDNAEGEGGEGDGKGGEGDGEPAFATARADIANATATAPGNDHFTNSDGDEQFARSANYTSPATAYLTQVLHSLAESDHDPNETSAAIKAHFQGVSHPQAWQTVRTIEFSSDTKYSGATFTTSSAGERASFVMGAAQYVLAGHDSTFQKIAPQLADLAKDSRVLLIAQIDDFDTQGRIQGTPRPLGFVAIRDEIRETAPQTIQYFKDQGVDLKVISGDDPKTVAGIAQKVGVPHADNYVDASTLRTQEDIAQAIQKYSVFGRVKPEQKKAFVDALQSQGHIVAMTGDGVNDVLSLKAADCSVAMASGSDAARSVAQLILVNNDFASMPKVVAEGRRSINNLQRSASLFLVKTMLSILLGIVFIFLPWQYPFEPIQMTLISAFTIGLPSFVLALEPNHDRVRGHFLQNCVTFSVPGAICSIISILVTTIVGNLSLDLSYSQVSTLCVYLMSYVGILLIIRLSIPFTPIRWALLVVVVGGLVCASLLFPALFDIRPLNAHMAAILIGGIIFNTVLFQLLYNLSERLHKKMLSPKK